MSVVWTPLASAATPESHDYSIRPIMANKVVVQDAFWSPRLETNRTATIPYAFEKCEQTGRIENFRVAGGLSDKQWQSENGYDDSDVSKVIEGASYSLMTHADKELEAYLATLVGYYAAAQEDDGYLYTLWTARDTVDIEKIRINPGDDRWGRIDFAHQLYNLGHMYEAGVAHWQATGDAALLDICRKSADCVAENFGLDKIEKPPGHQEIEIGLMKLYRETGDRRYLNLAKYFLDIRGHQTNGRGMYGTYSQDHEPVVDQSEGVGHAVRACYMYAAMADVAALTGDHDYLKAVDRIWENVVTKKMYLTGGIGAAGGHEGFAENYDLPNLSAYCETCAAVAMCMWNHRMYLMTGDAKYMDVLERTLYNGVLSGVSLDGKEFFYPNPLESDGRHARSPWFGTSCCPTNICRFIPSVPGYAFGQRGNALFVNLFISGDSKIEVDGGTVELAVETRYPWEGDVAINIKSAPKGSPVALKLRIPGWARGEATPGGLYQFTDQETEGATIEVNGKEVPIELENGYATVEREWSTGDVIRLNLPMPIRRVVANEAVEADRGKVALQRGPIVYCVEHPDVPEGRVTNLILPDSAELDAQFKKDLLGGVEVIEGETQAASYDTEGHLVKQAAAIQAIPYYAWAHRGRGEMAVWLARSESAARPVLQPTIASRAKASASRGDASAVSDQKEPKNSNDHDTRFQHFWPATGTTEWVQYDFDEPTKASAVEVYWFDDEPIGAGCRIPESWRLLAKQSEKWVEVSRPSAYGTKTDQYNRCEFDPVTTTALRLEIKLQEKWAGGVHEWRVE